MGSIPDIGRKVLSINKFHARHLPFHPVTGLQALGFTRRGPIWPVMGGSEDDGGDGSNTGGEQQQSGGAQGGNTDRGFPDKTPVDQMTLEQQLAYFRYHDNRKGEQLKKFGGLTPDQVKTLQTRNQELENQHLTADQKALKEATDKAATDAKAASDAEWASKYQQMALKAVAGPIIKDDNKLTEWLSTTNPAAFVGENGEIDEAKVKTHLTTLFGQPQQQNGFGTSRAWGQHGGTPPPQTPGSGGREEAKRRAEAAQRRAGVKQQ